MTQEEKSILLKDLCARLPYNVKVKYKDYIVTLGGYNDLSFFIYDEMPVDIEEIRPYLRPLSSMTGEKSDEIKSMGFAYWTTMINNDLRAWGPMSLLDAIITHHKMVKLIDWLNAHHFDYRGLIEKGLAIEAPEGMYGKF